MPTFQIKFKHHDPLIVDIVGTGLGRKYYQLVRKNYHAQPPVFRDQIRYNTALMLELAEQAKQQLGWNWTRDYYDLSVTPFLHKDLEQLLSQQGFSATTSETDHLLHELHYCLHVVQNQSRHNGKRTGALQLEWFNDDGFALPDDFEYVPQYEIGAIRLQNPYVGHGPVQMYLEQDFYNVQSTCKFPNFVKPGVLVALNSGRPITESVKKDIMDLYTQADAEFTELNQHNIRRYSGYGIIGQVRNIDTVLEIRNDPDELIFEEMEFDELA